VLQQALLNHLRRREIKRYVVTMITQVLVRGDDPAFQHPSKPIGPFLSKSKRKNGGTGWAEDHRGLGPGLAAPGALAQARARRAAAS